LSYTRIADRHFNLGACFVNPRVRILYAMNALLLTGGA